MKYGFVILNYNNYLDTIECAESILKIPRTDYSIVIVDNHSANESFQKLTEKYGAHEDIKLIKSDKNYGYSGGNNIGIRYLRGAGVTNIIIATNDTVLLTTDILDQLDSLDLRNVGLIGPTICTPEGVRQNPARIKPGLLYFLNLYLYSKWTFARNLAYQIIPLLERKRRVYLHGRRTILSACDPAADLRPSPVYMVHGSFMILTENFIENIGLFDENIFMYCEEDLLSWQCEKKGLKRIFLPTISVLHKDRKSTELAHKEEKNSFINTNNLKSLRYVRSKISLIEFIRCLIKYSIR